MSKGPRSNVFVTNLEQLFVKKYGQVCLALM